MRVSQFNQGRPFRLVSCDETTDLVSRLEAGIDDDNLRQLRGLEQKRALEGLPARKIRDVARKDRRQKKGTQKDFVAVFLSPKRKGQKLHTESPTICCSHRKCSSIRGCVAQDVSGIVAVAWYRGQFRELSQEAKRLRVAALMEVVEGEKRTYFYSKEELQQMYTTKSFRRGLDRPLSENDRVCHDFFIYALGISTTMLRQPTLDTSVRSLRYQPDLEKDRPRVGLKAEGVKRWLLWLADFYLHDPTRLVIQLPFANRSVVFDLYEKDWLEYKESGYVLNLDTPWTEHTLPFVGESPVRKQTFYNIWCQDKELRKKIIIRKFLRFSLCADCVRFIETRAYQLPKDELLLLKQQEHDHSAFVRRERLSYYTRRDLARAHPDLYMSVIIDGSDQAEFGSPHFCNRSKETADSWRIGTSLMGAIVHGYGVFGFSYMTNIKHGSNLTIEVLHRVMRKVWKNGKKKYLPDILFLQLDNTTRQCKSQFILGFCALLVAWGVFTEVVVSFLPVGHTHEDVDQLFSRIAEYLRKHDARSRDEFLEGFRAAFFNRKHPHEDKKHTGNIEQAANFSDYFKSKKLLESMLQMEGRQGITNFHQFKIKKEGGKVVMYVREWCAPSTLEMPFHGLAVDEFGRYLTRIDADGNKTFCPHVVFREDADLDFANIYLELPPSQRKDFATPEYLKTDKKTGVVSNTYFARTRAGVENYIRTRDIPEVHAADLRYCLNLLESTEDAYVEWDTKLYEEHIIRAQEYAAEVDEVPMDVSLDDDLNQAQACAKLSAQVSGSDRSDEEEEDDENFKPAAHFYEKGKCYFACIEDKPLWSLCVLKKLPWKEETAEGTFWQVAVVWLNPEKLPSTKKQALSASYQLFYKC